MERHNALVGESRRQMLAAGRGGAAGSMGFLAFSQAVEDAQYGIKGVLNNIPQMIMGFGGTMGLAGAISLAAVAAVTLYPHLKRLYNLTENENLKKAADEWATIFDKGMASARTLREESGQAASLARWTADIAQATQDRLRFQGAMVAAIEREITLRNEARNLENEVRDARARLNIARGDDSTLTQGQSDIAARSSEISALQEEAAAKRDIAARLAAEVQRISNQLRQEQANTLRETATRDQQLLTLRENLAGAEANAAAAQALIDAKVTGRDLGDARINLQRAQTAKTEIEAAIQRLQGERDSLKAVGDSAVSAAKAEIDSLDEKLRRVNDEATATQRLIAQRKELLDLARQTAAAEAAAAQARRETAAATKLAESISGQWNARLRKEIETQRSQQTARADIAVEIAALRLQASGQTAKAEALRTEVLLRSEAKDLAERLGITEDRAIRMLREKAALEQRILDTGRQRARLEETSAIRRSRSTINAAGGRRIDLLDGARLGDPRPVGLRDTLIDRRRTERSSRIQTADPSAFWSRQLDLQEKLLQQFTKLGIV